MKKNKIDRPRKKVCIVGAGIAGLAAASQLESLCDVVLLEARSYVGGRIKFDYSLGMPFPCGAAFVHGMKNNPVYSLLKSHQPVFFEFNQASAIIFDKNKIKYTDSDLIKSGNYFEKILNESKKRMENSSKDISLMDSIMKSNFHDENLFSWQLTYLSLFTGVEASYLSAKNWDQMDEFIGGDHLLLSSYDAWINSLSKDKNIFLNTVVNRIDYAGRYVSLNTNRGVVEADSVIVTVPLGVLQGNQIQFFPSLPDKKISAIYNLKMSQLNKIGLLFPKRFWPHSAVVIGCNLSSNVGLPLFFNYDYFFGKPVLLGAVSGEAAIELEKEGNAAFIQRAVYTLRELFGNNIPDPLKTVVTNWLSDPFSRGSYSYIPVGSSGVDFDLLAEPVFERLFFAGEATYRSCHSTVQGAYLSGIREAQRVLLS